LPPFSSEKLTRIIQLSLPADFLATHPFDGKSKIGHQVVINGFTYNPATKKGTFHVVNSWRVLPEFAVPVEPKDEAAAMPGHGGGRGITPRWFSGSRHKAAPSKEDDR
jgi:hypothetical protein